MAGDWIKMRTNLWDDPRVAKLCDLTDQAEAAVIGGLYWLWAAADQHTEDGKLPGLSLRQIDRKTGIQGFGDALCSIGWLVEHPEGAQIKNFNEHNGQSAKRRSMEAQRKANARSVSADDADNDRTEGGRGAELEKEKRREDITDPNGSVGGTKVPPCPHQTIIALYHERLPTGTQVREWGPARQKHLQARWREETRRQSLDWWSKFFDYCAESEFLTGRAAPQPGRDPFVVSLDWLVSPQNFAKVVEGKYHRRAA